MAPSSRPKREPYLGERLRQLAIPESWDLSSPSRLASPSIEVDRQAELIAYLKDFLVIGIICLCILPLIAFLERLPPADK